MIRNDVTYLKKLRVLSIEVRWANMVPFIPVLVNEATIVCEVLNYLVFSNFEALLILKPAFCNFESLLCLSST